MEFVYKIEEGRLSKGSDNTIIESKKRKAIPANCSFNLKQGGYQP